MGIRRESRHDDDLSLGTDRRKGQGQLSRLHQRAREEGDRYRIVSAQCIRGLRHGGGGGGGGGRRVGRGLVERKWPGSTARRIRVDKATMPGARVTRWFLQQRPPLSATHSAAF